MFKKNLISLTLLTFIAACSQDNPTIVTPGTGHSPDEKINFKLKLENISRADTLKLSDGKTVSLQISPGVWIIHTSNNPVFTAGQKDNGEGLEELAEDGDNVKLEANLKKKSGVLASGVFNRLNPGDSAEISFSAAAGSRLSLAAMFSQSNDLFFAGESNGINLFDKDNEPLKGDLSSQLMLWDAGTEENQEPGSGPDQAPRQTAANTGKSQNGLVQKITDARDGFNYPKVTDVLKITLSNDDVHDK